MQRRLILTLLVAMLALAEPADPTAPQRLARRRVRVTRTPDELERLQPPGEPIILVLEPGWRPQPLQVQDTILVDLGTRDAILWLPDGF